MLNMVDMTLMIPMHSGTELSDDCQMCLSSLLRVSFCTNVHPGGMTLDQELTHR